MNIYYMNGFRKVQWWYVDCGSRAISAPGSGDASAPSSAPEPEPELRKTSRASWSEISIKSICSRTSTFTSIEEILPMGAAHIGRHNINTLFMSKAIHVLTPYSTSLGTYWLMIGRLSHSFVNVQVFLNATNITIKHRL